MSDQLACHQLWSVLTLVKNLCTVVDLRERELLPVCGSHTRARTHAHACTLNTRAHAHTHTCTHTFNTNAHTCTHTHIHMCTHYTLHTLHTHTHTHTLNTHANTHTHTHSTHTQHTHTDMPYVYALYHYSPFSRSTSAAGHASKCCPGQRSSVKSVWRSAPSAMCGKWPAPTCTKPAAILYSSPSPTASLYHHSPCSSSVHEICIN